MSDRPREVEEKKAMEAADPAPTGMKTVGWRVEEGRHASHSYFYLTEAT
jgi:hypothetical protein